MVLAMKQYYTVHVRTAESGKVMSLFLERVVAASKTVL